jgi:hypothetical protein
LSFRTALRELLHGMSGDEFARLAVTEDHELDLRGV